MGRAFKYRGNMSKSILEVLLVNILVPGARPADTDSTKWRIWEKEVDGYMKCKIYLHKNTKQAYTLVHSQYCSTLVAKAEGTTDYPTFSASMGMIG
eukprot:10144068-Ditylum_brightwellii.AAC.1